MYFVVFCLVTALVTAIRKRGAAHGWNISILAGYSLCIKANNDNNDLITITTVTNENGEKVENVTFKNQFKSFDTDTQNKELYMLKNKIKTGDSYLTGSYMCMFLVSSV